MGIGLNTYVVYSKPPDFTSFSIDTGGSARL